VVNTPDYEAQARWLAWADARAAEGEEVKNLINHDYLRATTIFPGSRFAGRLCFNRDKAFQTGEGRINLGARTYVFPLPASASAPTPHSAPELPSVGTLSAANVDPAPTSSSDPQQSSSSTKAGVLGVSGANWINQGITGVEILDIAPNSAAQAAGLHVGYVITDVNGRKLQSTEDLADVLRQNGPGSEISIDYLFRSNLGWMPGASTVVLRNR